MLKSTEILLSFTALSGDTVTLKRITYFKVLSHYKISYTWDGPISGRPSTISTTSWNFDDAMENYEIFVSVTEIM